ncbi:hypothetical protein [Dactylosporangium sp. NPDC006015]|uniref:hypothetical protein n=1 Tax=Dactylosporangium sp. NPDC006015 TaxID=3154576 RepID=UPI0033ADBD71
MRRTRIGLLLSAVILVIVGSLPGVALADPTPGETGQGGQHENWLKNVLHGEGIVQTKKGPIRVAMQNGTATAATETSVTVRSTDGYTKTWTLAQNAKIYNDHMSVQPGALQAGSMVVVGGPITVSGGGGSPAASPTTTYTAQIVLIQSTAGTGTGTGTETPAPAPATS